LTTPRVVSITVDDNALLHITTAVLSGSGTIEVTVANTLDAVISGSGTVYYKGHPSITLSISGSGSLVDAN
jgi:hypothetical protein